MEGVTLSPPPLVTPLVVLFVWYDHSLSSDWQRVVRGFEVKRSESDEGYFVPVNLDEVIEHSHYVNLCEIYTTTLTFFRI